MQIPLKRMKQKNNGPLQLCLLFPAIAWLFFLTGCNTNSPVSLKTSITGYDKDVLNSVLTDPDSLRAMPFVEKRILAIKEALTNPLPVMLCQDSLGSNQQLAQLIALSDPDFTQYVRNTSNQLPFRNEVFGVYPARQSDIATLTQPGSLEDLYRVDMYNYGLNLSSFAIVDLKRKQVLLHSHQPQSQPDIPETLKKLAIEIAAASPEVQQALGFKPGEKDALMAGTKTALNRTRCERSHHLCVAPTFIKNDKALWAIVDLTDYRLAGVRWTNVGNTGPAAAITERRLQDDKITSCFCEQEQDVSEHGWSMKYMLTSSDGLRISGVSFNNKPVLRSAKLVDWHVSYSGTDGFGYSDAVGCPYFSQAAVIAWEVPKLAEMTDEKNKVIGFALEQVFRSEGWPTPCNYNYRQRYEFYNDGRFRIACASVGRGCGNDGTYRPVFRIAFAGENNNFNSWDGEGWKIWDKEQWQEQNSVSSYTKEGYMYKLSSEQGGYFIEPGHGQFADGGKGDFSFTYVTKYAAGRDEGENDLSTIGPCCNTDYHQGPEKFIEPQPESINNSSLVLWYVAQLKNDDRKGNEYCWAEAVLENGVYSTKAYPCFCGPMFIPVK
jgi:hypothetical protein